MEEKLKIFFCEDDENLGMLLREYLQAKGYVTDLFSDGEAGYKGFIAEIPQYGSVVGKTIMLPIFVAVYIHLAGARALFLIIRGFYVNQFAVGI